MKNPMNTMKNPSLFLLTALLAAACGAPADEAPATEAADTAATVMTGERPALVAPADAKLRLVAAPPAAQFPDAALKLELLTPNESTKEVEYKFAVSGFDLKAQTPDAATRGCANSADGQHIHYILNNKPYLAKYEAAFTEKADDGANVVLCFLSRSYHESLKNNASVVVQHFDMPANGSAATVDIEKDPLLFYSRPKGDYKQLDGDKILLDFYLLNTDLEQEGYSVRATIDGEVWTINKWDAYFIEGMELGQHTVRLELVDGNGQAVPGPFNDSGVREFSYLGS